MVFWIGDMRVTCYVSVRLRNPDHAVEVKKKPRRIGRDIAVLSAQTVLEVVGNPKPSGQATVVFEITKRDARTAPS